MPFFILTLFFSIHRKQNLAKFWGAGGTAGFYGSAFNKIVMDLADVGIYRFIMMHGTIIRALIIVSRVSGFIYFAKEKHLTWR